MRRPVVTALAKRRDWPKGVTPTYPLHQSPPPISIKLFDSLVTPILEYGAEIWAPLVSVEPLEKLHIR